MFNWLRKKIKSEKICDYCGEKTHLWRRIGDLAHMGIGSIRCDKCEKAADLKREKAFIQSQKDYDNYKPTKEQLKWRRKRDELLQR